MQIKQEKQSNPSIPEGSASSPKLLQIRRECQVPVARLFEAFASAEALKAWWWPKGLHADRIDFDFREGGRYFISMKGQVQGKDASGGMTGEFEEIVRKRAHRDDRHLRGRKGTSDLGPGGGNARAMAGADLHHV